MVQLNIAVCEDDRADRERLCGMIAASAVPAGTAAFESGEAFLSAYQPELFDLIFMDIYLSGLDGVEAVRRVRELEKDVPVAFTTTSKDHALDGYRLEVARYIEKPVSQRAVDDMLALALSKKAERTGAVIVLGQKTPLRLPIPQLRYAEQKGHYLMLHLTGGRVMQKKGKLDDLAPQLGDYPFFRCHKSYLANLSFVTGIDRERMMFQMRGGGNVYIRREDFWKARSAWEDWLYAAARRKDVTTDE